LARVTQERDFLRETATFFAKASCRDIRRLSVAAMSSRAPDMPLSEGVAQWLHA
jgi:hypothetical protein